MAGRLRRSFAALPQAVRDEALWRKFNLDFVDMILNNDELKVRAAALARDGGVNWLSKRPELGFTLCGLVAHAHAKVLDDLDELGFEPPAKPESGFNIKRWQWMFEAGGRRLIALAPQEVGAPQKSTLQEEVMALIEKLTAEKFMRPRGCSVDTLHKLVIGAIQDANKARLDDGKRGDLKIPSRRAIERHIERNWSKAVVDTIRKNIKSKNRELLEKWDLEKYNPLDIVEVDDTPFDMMILNPPPDYDNDSSDSNKKSPKKPAQKKRRAARPTLTMVTDIRTKVVLSFLLTWEKPSAELAKRALMLAIQSKPNQSFRYEAVQRAPQGGKPRLLVVDNGSGFKAKDFQEQCDELRINVLNTEPYSPEQKPHIERLIKTIQEGFCKGKRGYTVGDLRERRAGGDPETEAVWTIEEARKNLGRYIYDEYHTHCHTTLKNEWPIECWNRLTQIHQPAQPDSAHAALIFGTSANVAVGRNGAVFENLFYDSSKLKDILARDNETRATYEIRYNPHDLMFVALIDPHEQELIRLDCTTPDEIRGLTLEEWKIKDEPRRARRRTANFSQSAVDAARAIDAAQEAAIARAEGRVSDRALQSGGEGGTLPQAAQHAREPRVNATGAVAEASPTPSESYWRATQGDARGFFD